VQIEMEIVRAVFCLKNNQKTLISLHVVFLEVFQRLQAQRRSFTRSAKNCGSGLAREGVVKSNIDVG